MPEGIARRPPQTHNSDAAVLLLGDVKLRFEGDLQVYDKIFVALQEFKERRMSVATFADALNSTLRDHNDLKIRFNEYLPDGYKLPVADEKSKHWTEGLQVVGSVPQSRENTQGRHVQYHLSDPRQIHDPSRSNTRENPRDSYARKDKRMMTTQHEPQPHKKQKVYKVPPDVAERIRCMKVWVGGQASQTMFDASVQFICAIKEHYHDQPEVAKAFCTAIRAYASKSISLQGLLEQVSTLFQNEASLLEQFEYFLEDQPGGAALLQKCSWRLRNPGLVLDSYGENESEIANSESSEIHKAGITSDKGARRLVDQEMEFLRKLKGSLRSSKTYNSFLKLLNLYSLDVIDQQQLKNLAERVLRQGNGSMEEFQRFLKRCNSRSYGDLSDRDHPLIKIAKAKKRDYDRKPIQELDTSNMERCTPSYLMLPPDYPKLDCAGMTEICKEVLNDIMVSLPTGSEEFSSKHLQRNIHEEQLFRLEDRLTEIDVSMSRCQVTIVAAKKLLSDLEEACKGQRTKLITPTKYFSAIHVRVIKNLYGTRAEKLFDLLCEQPLNTVRVIVSRLSQKLEDWSSARKDVLASSQKNFQENYAKSLDHESGIFKQNDKKMLSLKGLLPEVLAAAKQKISPSMEVLQTCGVLPWKAVMGAPHLSYTISNKAIWGTMMEYIVAYAEFTSSIQDCSAAMRFWNSFVVPFLGIGDFSGVQSYSGRGLGGMKGNVSVDREEKQLERKFSGCDPLSTVAMKKTEESKSKQQSVLFCTTQYYGFFRLLQTLYDRFETAKHLCKVAAAKTGLQNSAKIESQFFAVLKKFLSLQCLQEEYEDECRKLLGVKCYILFTLDQVLGNICKQMQLLASSETLDLYHYHKKQGCMHEDTYFCNASVLLCSEPGFRVEIIEDCAIGEKILNIHSIKWADHLPEKDGRKSQNSKYSLSTFMIEPTSSGNWNAVRVLISRNLKCGGMLSHENGENVADNVGMQKHELLRKKRLEMTHIENGLEWKISSQGCKIEYVPGTEDVQFCRGWNNTSANRISSKAIRQQKFFDWVEQRTKQWSVMSVQTNI